MSVLTSPLTIWLGTASANGSTKPFGEPLSCYCADVVFLSIDGRMCWPRLFTPSDRSSACLLMKRPTRDCFASLGDLWIVWRCLHGCWRPELCCCVDMWDVRAIRSAILWSLWKGTRLTLSCVYQMARNARYLPPGAEPDIFILGGHWRSQFCNKGSCQWSV